MSNSGSFTCKKSSKYKRNSRNRSGDEESNHEKKHIWLGGCRYDVVLRVAMEMNYDMVGEMDLWHMSWTDIPLSPEKIMEIKRLQNLVGINGPPIQKLNHFPGMYEICRKDRLGRNLNRLKRVFPKEYEFFPSTWDLPSDMADLQEFGKKHKFSTYIVKPDSGCQGKGIFLIKNLKLLCPFAKCVCQQYISQPFLIDGYKFDQRIYVLLTCVDPLRVYIYQEGIARFATVKYQLPTEGNLDVTYMHLTNYSLNKFSDAFDPECGGTKRPLSTIYDWMKNNGYDVQKLQNEIDDVVVKTIVCVAPTLRHNYRATFPKREKGCYCFEILGFDIMVDRHMKPMLIEVNHSPSFNLDTEVDHDVKLALVRDVFGMIYMGDQPPGHIWKKDPLTKDKYNIQRRPGTPYASTIPDALKDQFAYEELHKNKFRLIFSEENPGKFAQFMDKEYFVMDYEEQLFVKKRPVPFMNELMMSGPPQKGLPNMTSIRRSENGQVYIETRPETPPNLLNPHEFLKFKYNANLTEAGSRLLRNSRPRSARTQRKSLFDRKLPFMEEQLHEPVVPKESEPIKKIFRQKEQSKLSPSQRVQIALEQLRRKNVEKFKTITQRNKAMLHSSTLQAIEEQRSSRFQFQLPLTPDNRILTPMSRPETHSNVTSTSQSTATQQPNFSVLELDSAKLPSVFQRVFNSTKLHMEASAPVKKDTGSQSQDAVGEWLSKFSTGKGEIMPAEKPIPHLHNIKELDKLNNNETQLTKSPSLVVIKDGSRRSRKIISRKRSVKRR